MSNQDTRSNSTREGSVVFLVDVDNTLLDNDRIIADLERHLGREVGSQHATQYWEIFERLRSELGYVDYLGAFQRLRLVHPRDHRISGLANFLLDYRFDDCVLPGARQVLETLVEHGPTVILSDGDAVLQPRKIERAGLAAAVEGRVLVYVHKEEELEDIERCFPAAHYVIVDDKVRILAAVKQVWGERVTTVFPKQGRYAHDPAVASYPRPDYTIEHIAELSEFEWPMLVERMRSR